MRYLILGDIHANWEALQAVLADAKGLYDQILCTGDLVGYGADPGKVVEWARDGSIPCVRGNHDKVCCGLDDAEWFNPGARSAILWTRSALAAADLEYLRGLPRGPVTVDGFGLMHGSPTDEDEYLVEVSDLRRVGSYLENLLSFAGHTHLQGGFLWPTPENVRKNRPTGGTAWPTGSEVLAVQCGTDGFVCQSDDSFSRSEGSVIPQTPRKARELRFKIPDKCFCLSNPGAVGQPRDGDPRAAYLLYSPEDRVITYRRVAYDVAAAQRKILDAGLAPRLAARLEAGT